MSSGNSFYDPTAGCIVRRYLTSIYVRRLPLPAEVFTGCVDITLQ